MSPQIVPCAVTWRVVENAIIKSHEHSVPELVAARLSGAGWIESTPRITNDTAALNTQLVWTKNGLKKAKALGELLSELDYLPEGRRKVGEILADVYSSRFEMTVQWPPRQTDLNSQAVPLGYLWI